MKISSFSVKRPVFTLVTMFLVIILGAVSFFKIPVTLIPDLNPPVAVVVTNYPGASPTEVSEKITKPLEESLSTAPGLKSMQTSSQEGANLVFLQFDWDSSIDDVQMDILQRIDQVEVPDGANKPRFMKFDPSQFPVIQLSLRSVDKDTNIRKIAEELEKELRRIEGVASVNVSGKIIEDVQVILDPDKLKEFGLAQSDVVQAIQASNVSMPGDPIDTSDGRKLTTRILSTVQNISDVRSIQIGANPKTGDMINVSDVADVALLEPKVQTETRANDEQAVLLSVLQESGANTATVSKEFKKSLDTLLEKDAYKDIESDVIFDQGDYVQLAIGNIGQSLILGGLFAMLVLFVFLRGIKSPIIIGVAIPYSVIVTFVLMYFSDFSLNIMTLGALALGIGMLVDNAIVVIENIERHLAMGKTPTEAAKDGSKEVGGAITASTLTTLAVFVPIIFITGIIGQIFTEFALTISFSLFASLVVALTVVPMLASRLLKTPTEEMLEKKNRVKKNQRFENSVKWALSHRLLVLLITTALLVGSVFGILKVGTEFLPATDEGSFSINVKLPNGASLDATNDVVERIEEEMKKQDDVEVYVSLVGGTQQSMAQGGSESNMAEVYVKLIPLDDRDRSVFEFVDKVQPIVEDEIGDDAEISFNLQTAAGSSPNTLAFSLNDTNEERLSKAVSQIDEKLREMDTVTEVTNDLVDTVEEIKIEVDREKASEVGLAPYQIAQTVSDVTRGVSASQIVFEKTGEVVGVNVSYDERFRNSVDKLKELELKTPLDTFVKLKDVADVEIAEGPATIVRVDQAHSIAFTVKYLSSESLGDMTKKVNDMVEDLDLPSEVELSYGGDRELFENAIDDMLLAIILAVVLVYIVMAAQFESFKYPFVIMFSVPLMLIGVALALFFTNTPVSVTAVIGLLILVGIVVNNGIVLVDYINQRKEAGLSSYDAIMSSVRDRVRPILMTALTTILGLLPLALGLGEGSELNQPMGIAVIGGLISSTFLTLYIVPIIYSLLDRETRRGRNTPNREQAVTVDQPVKVTETVTVTVTETVTVRETK
ncbi:MFS transporter [Sporosarcina sp. P21c]|uniref:efflux RND transporter permease subunit n=1 Tax=unclassified Sporosarcina TaxID=2647733 RepID=UPI000C17008D|nr:MULTISPECIES: efflux RND transporter permease subunit [unclassified Sporosarcina]PIC66549.1 MFS transporter [Sporosarcina sp. P16a]PIC82003.1 MFS transporter [Sporosarcina sp. P1]PIC89959.1 MFS transporter [Sporosarcina sp. P21c]PIC93154.1 MFS transporter [Sporosarcina sp. P25]